MLLHQCIASSISLDASPVVHGTTKDDFDKSRTSGFERMVVRDVSQSARRIARFGQVFGVLVVEARDELIEEMAVDDESVRNFVSMG